jgi:hypothetical protein
MTLSGVRTSPAARAPSPNLLCKLPLEALPAILPGSAHRYRGGLANGRTDDLTASARPTWPDRRPPWPTRGWMRLND